MDDDYDDITFSFTGPELVFIASDRTVHYVDQDGWDVGRLSRRDQMVLAAFLTLAQRALKGGDT